MRKEILSITDVANLLSKIYSGPFLIPRETIITEVDDTFSASSAIEITAENPFMLWHKNTLLDIILIEFMKQLGCIIVLKKLGLRDFPYMCNISAEMKLPINIGDSIMATTKFIARKKQFIFFEGEVKKIDGTLAVESVFYGISSK